MSRERSNVWRAWKFLYARFPARQAEAEKSIETGKNMTSENGIFPYYHEIKLRTEYTHHFSSPVYKRSPNIPYIPAPAVAKCSMYTESRPCYL